MCNANVNVQVPPRRFADVLADGRFDGGILAFHGACTISVFVGFKHVQVA